MRENREDLSGLELGLSTAKEELPTRNLNEADAGRCVKSCRPKGLPWNHLRTQLSYGRD